MGIPQRNTEGTWDQFGLAVKRCSAYKIYTWYYAEYWVSETVLCMCGVRVVFG